MLKQAAATKRTAKSFSQSACRLPFWKFPFFFSPPDLITCQLGREIHHIPKDSSSWIWGHHQRNLIAYRCPETSDCIIHQPAVEESENEAVMSSKTPHSAHAWPSDSETLLSNTKTSLRPCYCGNNGDFPLNSQHNALFWYVLYVSVMLACMCASVHVQQKYLCLMPLVLPNTHYNELILNTLSKDNWNLLFWIRTALVWEFAHSRYSDFDTIFYTYSQYAGISHQHTLASSLSFPPTHIHTHTPNYSCSRLIQYQQCHQPIGQSEISFAVQTQETEGGYSRLITSQWNTRWRETVTSDQVNICQLSPSTRWR